MSTHSPSAGHHRPSPTAPWIVVAVLIAGALFIGGALVAGSLVLVVIGAVLVFLGLVSAAALSHRGAAPLSFTQEFPENTYGPRSTIGGDSSPPIDTNPNAQPGVEDYRTVEEVDAAEVSDPPDDGRVFPQYSNLGPDERLRNIDGRDVIERAEPPESYERKRD